MTPDALKIILDGFRAGIKTMTEEAVTLKGQVMGTTDPHFHGEVAANLTIAYRHLEDAAMRFGKAIQASQGGESPLGGPDTPAA